MNGPSRLVSMWVGGLLALGIVAIAAWGGVGICFFSGSTLCGVTVSFDRDVPPLRAPLPQTAERTPAGNEQSQRRPSAGTASDPVVPTAGNLTTANPKYVALVIGNSNYSPPNKLLKNPKNDAVAIAESLRSLNYTLVGGGAHFDLNYDEMRQLLLSFKRAAANAAVGFVYYAGHGIQTDSREPIYLIPVSAKLQQEDELNIEAIPLSFVTATLPKEVLADGTEQVGVVVLDACRTSNYPMMGLEAAKRGTGQRGLKAVKAPKRSYIAFSATAGEPASDGEGVNSPYAISLLRRMKDKDLPDIKAVFDRVDRDFEENNEDQVPVKDDKLANRKIRLAAPQAPPPVWTKRRDCLKCPEIVVLPAGKFLMGSPGEKNSDGSEFPQHEVTVKSFAISTHEISVKEWRACVASGGCLREGGDWRLAEQKDEWPIVAIGWYDAQEYVRWLQLTTLNNYRLLSESEWEYAARAGSTTAYPWGNDPDPDLANYGGASRYVYEFKKVGSYPSNKFGLFDMHGNVFEWVEDCWNDGYKGAPTDGRAWTSGKCENRVMRGGGCVNYSLCLRSAYRSPKDPSYRDDSVGFRVARTL